MEKWLIKSAKNNLADFGKTQDEKILYRIIANRGIENSDELDKFLNPSLSNLLDQTQMKDLEKAGEILLEAIDNQEKIRIIGDYDVDGIMSTYILYKFISKENSLTDYEIPHRVADGYGINTQMVEAAAQSGVKLIITCDNGISAFDAINLAKEKGIKVIVLDHHEPQVVNGKQVVPNGDAIVDHKQDDCPYPFKGLCGAAISYKFIEYVSSILGYEEGEIVRDYLEFAAIATVCDVMDLVGENRIIVYYGLKLLNNTSNLGLKTLIKTAQLDDKIIQPYHLGFIIGPLFNASGRLDTAKKGLELLLEEDIRRAQSLASELKELNEERTKLTKEGLELYLKEIEANGYYKDDIIVAYIEGVHESLAGIIAGRVKEKYNKPTIILTSGDGYAKGSARSIDEYNITEGISETKDLLRSFGGHKLAAGVSLNSENIEEFRSRLNSNSGLTKEDFYKKIMIDLGLPINFVSLDLIELLEQIGPYGNGNPRPIFGTKKVFLGNFKILGKNKNVLKMSVRENNTFIDGIMFSNLEKFEEDLEKAGFSMANLLLSREEVVADIVYSPNINEWQGNKNIQLNIVSFRLEGRD